MTRQVYFAVFPGVEILDLAGPAQALWEAAALGAPYAIQYCGLDAAAPTAQGLELAGLRPLPQAGPDDWIFVPGYPIATTAVPAALIAWLRAAAAAGARICSICTGAFALGEAGLLDGRQSTTHWRRIGELRARFPQARVLDNRLYVADGPIVTSAGIAAGIDMIIGLLEEDAGPALASGVAREMVVYLRRDGAHPQTSVYLQFQEHLSASVHQIQQYLISEPLSDLTIAELAASVHLSPRHLTRSFRRATGISIGDFRLRLRLERARSMLLHSEMKLAAIAEACGFADPRQLRRLWSKHFGAPPSAFRGARRQRGSAGAVGGG